MYTRRKLQINIILEEENFNNVLENRDVYKYYYDLIMNYMTDLNKMFSIEPEKDYLKLEITGEENRKDISDVTS